MTGAEPTHRMTPITREQSRDTGMAMVLLLLIVRLRFGADQWLWGALVLQVLVMTVPRIFRPVAVVWLGLSHVLGAISSRVLLGAVFFLVVTPIGVLRRLSGADAMRLKGFGAGKASAFVVRRHTFTRRDLEKPY
jgi:hypothetical protein